ncbi:major capsid protein [Peptostreptococcus anaerobius]|uniref:major capsid protein n=1 Tax=Peptostreptococcus anaerobius TaxID=1261 RepID=UPI00321AE14E
MNRKRGIVNGSNIRTSKLNVQDDLQLGVIDEFRKSTWLFDNLIFDDVVSATGGGATLTYAYTRLKTQPTAGFRNVNEEYATSEVEKQRFTADLKIFGGGFKVDRVIANMGGIADEVALQMAQKIKAAGALFNDTVINGDSAVDSKSSSMANLPIRQLKNKYLIIGKAGENPTFL